MKIPLLFSVFTIALIAICIGVQSGSHASTPSPGTALQSVEKKLTYSDIQPLLKQKCGKCHGPQAEGDLSLLTYDDLMSGGEHGKEVVAGKPDKSPLYTKLTETPPFGKQMPKKGEKLTDDEMNSIKQWILDGAKE